MSVVSVRAKDFILALFIRDDGERFLLGDNGFDFKNSQLHFVANVMENDEVEKQGTDGTMLAGQVRRSSVQSFDGYVGDGTTPKETVEDRRREFFRFFAKGHHFRVVYIDTARNAWQRKGGYIVDAPEIKELYQVHPEYHVGLNFEDVNYYVYDEDADGNEILGNVQSVPVSSEIEGGLEWDANGAISEDAVMSTDTGSKTGKTIQISDAALAPFKSIQIDGETSQQTYSGKNLCGIPDQTFTHAGVPVTIKDNEITLNGTATGTGTRNIPLIKSTVLNGSYTTNLIYVSGSTSNSAANINLRRTSDHSLVGGTQADIKASNNYRAYSVSNESVELGLYINPNGAVFNNLKFKVQIVAGSAADYNFEPYVGGVPSPNPDYPQNVRVVTGENVVKISDGQGNEQSYTIDLGSIELCKIGTYQDYIYKSGDKWYMRKATGKYVYNNDLSDNGIGSTYVGMLTPVLPILPNISQGSGLFWCNSYTPTMQNNTGIYGTTSASRIRINTSLNIADSYAAVRALAAANNLTIRYPLATPTDTEITNAALVAQLEAILDSGTFAGLNNIAFIPSGNEQGTLELVYYKTYEVLGGGYVWEDGGTGGPTTIINNSIDSVYPVWTITGPTLNPILENTTTGEQIEFVGMVGEGQTLVIDMGEQTAMLDGLNVLSSLVGEFISLAPGKNILLYSASGDAGPSEIGWSEIVG